MLGFGAIAEYTIGELGGLDLVLSSAETVDVSEAYVKCRDVIVFRAATIESDDAYVTAREVVRIYADEIDADEQSMLARALARLKGEIGQLADVALDVVPMFLRPNATVVQAGWTTQSGGSNLHDAVDEVDYNDSDYIVSASDPVNDTCVISLAHISSYALAKPVKLRIRARNVNGATLTAKLYDGETEIASRDIEGLTGTYQTIEIILTDEEAQAMIDAVDRRLALIADAA